MRPSGKKSISTPTPKRLSKIIKLSIKEDKRLEVYKGYDIYLNILIEDKTHVKIHS